MSRHSETHALVRYSKGGDDKRLARRRANFQHVRKLGQQFNYIAGPSGNFAGTPQANSGSGSGVVGSDGYSGGGDGGGGAV